MIDVHIDIYIYCKKINILFLVMQKAEWTAIGVLMGLLRLIEVLHWLGPADVEEEEMVQEEEEEEEEEVEESDGCEEDEEDNGDKEDDFDDLSYSSF